MAVKIEFDTINASFADKEQEITWVLYTIANNISRGYNESNIRDYNGNTIGKYTVD